MLVLRHGYFSIVLRDTETANIPLLEVLTGALRCCSSVVWPATLPSERLALHPASTSKNGTLAISVPLNVKNPVWREPNGVFCTAIFCV